MKINGMEIVVTAPSYKRPAGVDTLKYLPSTLIYVAESEYEEYRKNNPTAHIVPVEDKYQGNLCRIRNRILELNKGKIVVGIDDDLQGIYYWERKLRRKLATEDDFLNFVTKYSVLAIDLGVKLWGINVNQDKQCYREYTPFSMTSYIGGPFMVHIDSPLRFDERFPLKEDYDLTLQHLNKYRKVLRINKYFYVTKQAEQAGGCATYRTTDKEKEQLLLLQKKWGNKIIKTENLTTSRSHNTTKKRNFDINPILQAPIKGV